MSAFIANKKIVLDGNLEILVSEEYQNDINEIQIEKNSGFVEGDIKNILNRPYLVGLLTSNEDLLSQSEGLIHRHLTSFRAGIPLELCYHNELKYFGQFEIENTWKTGQFIDPMIAKFNTMGIASTAARVSFYYLMELTEHYLKLLGAKVAVNFQYGIIENSFAYKISLPIGKDALDRFFSPKILELLTSKIFPNSSFVKIRYLDDSHMLVLEVVTDKNLMIGFFCDLHGVLESSAASGMPQEDLPQFAIPFENVECLLPPSSGPEKISEKIERIGFQKVWAEELSENIRVNVGTEVIDDIQRVLVKGYREHLLKPWVVRELSGIYPEDELSNYSKVEHNQWVIKTVAQIGKSMSGFDQVKAKKIMMELKAFQEKQIAHTSRASDLKNEMSTFLVDLIDQEDLIFNIEEEWSARMLDKIQNNFSAGGELLEGTEEEIQNEVPLKTYIEEELETHLTDRLLKAESAPSDVSYFQQEIVMLKQQLKVNQLAAKQEKSRLTAANFQLESEVKRLRTRVLSLTEAQAENMVEKENSDLLIQNSTAELKKQLQELRFENERMKQDFTLKEKKWELQVQSLTNASKNESINPSTTSVSHQSDKSTDVNLSKELEQSQAKIKELEHKMKMVQKLADQAQGAAMKRNVSTDARSQMKMQALEKNVARLEGEKKKLEQVIIDAKKEAQNYKKEAVTLKNLLELKDKEVNKLKKAS